MICQGTFQGIFHNVDNISIFGGTFTSVYYERTDHAGSDFQVGRLFFFAEAGPHR